MCKLLSGKWLSQCLHDLHQPRMQHFWGPSEGSMTWLCHSPRHSVPDSPFCHFPCPDCHTHTLPPAWPLSAEPCASARQSQQEARGPWEQWHPAEQGKTLLNITLCMTCCKNQPSWGLFLIASCLAAKNTILSNQHWLGWRGAPGKVALQASTPFPLL